MSKGVEIIGTFNNESKSEVDAIKAKAAELVDLIHEHGKNDRHVEMAIEHIEIGTMLGVKSLFPTKKTEE